MKLRISFLICVLGLMTLNPLFAQVAVDTCIQNEALKLELLKMGEADQRYAMQVDSVIKNYGLESQESKALAKRQDELSKIQIKRLEEIITEFGWPGISLVGEEACASAFTILQHADLKYKKKYLPVVKEAAQKGEIKPSDVAMLEDRILTSEGKKQIYGTQLFVNKETGKYELYPIKDEINVDKRRAKVGLPPLAEYLKYFGINYIPPQKEK